MEIMMPINVLCDKCKGCPQLEILDQQDTFYAGDKVIGTEHRLSCKNLERCERTRDYLTGCEQIRMKEVDEYVGMDSMGDRGSSFSDLRSEDLLNFTFAYKDGDIHRG